MIKLLCNYGANLALENKAGLTPEEHITQEPFYGDNLDTRGLFIKENSDNSFTLIGTKYGHENLSKAQSLFIRTNPQGKL